jgi:ribosomal peptide maturation radical SAM protein 1
MKPVALVSMPTLSAYFPSFQLALLKPTLEREGIPVQPLSLFLAFGPFIGSRLNEVISEVRDGMVGEWIWAKAAFGDFADPAAYLKRYDASLHSVCEEAGCSLDDLLHVRDETAFAFLGHCLQNVDWQQFGLIGFSVVFQQMLSSVALARRLKDRFPSIPIVFGGATFEDDIAEEILRGCPWIDLVHCGDADRTFPELVRRLDEGRSLEGLPGLMWRDRGRVVYNGRAPNLADLDSTPVPDFDEYFQALERGSAPDAASDRVLLPIETARGCWWGMKNHCTFCGLNRAGMEFRAKSVDNVLDMLRVLSSRYGQTYFNAIDNILEPEYVEGLFSRLAELRSDIRLHYEIRPSLTRTQLRKMRDGGLYSVQPGIESFSTHLLHLMKKHTTGMRNLELLKWTTYHGIEDLYNLLLGFPGETPEDYRLQAEVIAKIPHLQPPYTITVARPDRGSPMFEQPGLHSITQLRPAACYPFLFPADRFDLRRVSYFFEHEMQDVVDRSLYDPLYAQVAEWKHRWKAQPRPFLRYRKGIDSLLVEDGRRGSAVRTQLSGRAAQLYEFCADARKRQALLERFDGDAEWLDSILAELVRLDLVIFLDDAYLSLALPVNPGF